MNNITLKTKIDYTVFVKLDKSFDQNIEFDLDDFLKYCNDEEYKFETVSELIYEIENYLSNERILEDIPKNHNEQIDEIGDLKILNMNEILPFFKDYMEKLDECCELSLERGFNYCSNCGKRLI